MENQVVEAKHSKAFHLSVAVVLEAIAILFLFFVGAKMQEAWGLVGVITTEIGFVAIALITMLVQKQSFKEMFPIKKVSGRDVAGVVVLVIGGMLLALIITGISLVIVPNALDEVAGLAEFLYVGNSLPMMVLTIAVMPAICEEMLHRGAIFSQVKKLDKEWLIILVMGIFFGFFHLSFTKFLSTAILGMMLSYLMVKKNNILLPMLYHFLNNLMSTFAGTSTNVDASTLEAFSDINPITILGSYLIMGCLAPVLLVLANKLISPETYKKKHFLYAWIITAVLFIAGVAITGVTAMNMVSAM